jgi:hypothetical protein
MAKRPTVLVEPDARMSIAFTAEIRRQAGKLPAASAEREPLWAAVLAVAPPPAGEPRAEGAAYGRRSLEFRH